jgi:hypothetical protein
MTMVPGRVLYVISAVMLGVGNVSPDEGIIRDPAYMTASEQ